MENIYNETGAKVVVDSAFRLGSARFMVKSSQEDPDDPQALLINRDATSIR